MSTDKFFSIDTTDRISRVLMTVFTGIVLGVVLVRILYSMINPPIDLILGVIALYSVFFALYMYFSEIKKTAVKVAFFKDYLSIILKKGNGISERKDIAYSNIKSYTVYAIESKEIKVLWHTFKKKPSFRTYGYKTVIEMNDGEIFEFKNVKKTDGAIIYSPAYIYALYDVKRYYPSFNLEFVGFETKKDFEGIDYQMTYYQKTGKTPKVWENKKYMKSLTEYTFWFFVAAVIVVLLVIFKDKANQVSILAVTYSSLRALFAIVIPMWSLAVTVSICGGKRNEFAQNEIKNVIQPEEQEV